MCATGPDEILHGHSKDMIMRCLAQELGIPL